MSLPSILFARIGLDPGSSPSAGLSDLYSPWELMFSLLGYFGLILLPICLLAWGASYFLSLPMRRNERARFFLDLLELALQQGRPVEHALVDMARSKDLVMGVRFYLLTAHLEGGVRLGTALEKVPRLLPPQISAMLKVGEEMGDLRKVLPACRYALGDAQSSVRGAASYLVVFAFVLSPIAILIFNALAIYVFPRFSEILSEFTENSSPIFNFTQRIWGWLTIGQTGLLVVLLLAAFFYIGGPRVVSWFQLGTFPIADWIAWRLPWKLKRMQRNFSGMLAVLLDGGVAEADALRLAGECAANEVFRRRAVTARSALTQGIKLTEAVQVLDDRGEFQWRLTNAVHGHGGFRQALTGWQEALDAKAFQQEQAAAHLVTSALVLANGVIVAIAAVGIFGALISIIEAGVLW